jgi:hypothetical protein
MRIHLVTPDSTGPLADQDAGQLWANLFTKLDLAFTNLFTNSPLIGVCAGSGLDRSSDMWDSRRGQYSGGLTSADGCR